MKNDIAAARARAEAQFKTPKPESGAGSEEDGAARALRDRTEKLRQMRLAQEALARKGAEIRKDRRRGPSGASSPATRHGGPSGKGVDGG